MVDTKTYASHLQDRLIEDFKTKFHEKVGYVPIIITKVYIDDENELPLMTLQKLADCFDPFMPELYGSRLSLTSSSRKRELVELRNIFCAVARMMRFTLKSIGSFLGGRDHTTVLHNVTVFNNLIQTSESFRTKYITILTYIKEHYESSALVEFNQEQRQS